MNTLHRHLRELCVAKLADILYHNVECNVLPRSLVDWKTAEAFIDKNPVPFNAICRRFIGRNPAPSSQRLVTNENVFTCEPYYWRETFNYVSGRDVWDFLYQPIQAELIKSGSFYTRIIFG